MQERAWMMEVYGEMERWMRTGWVEGKCERDWVEKRVWVGEEERQSGVGVDEGSGLRTECGCGVEKGWRRRQCDRGSECREWRWRRGLGYQNADVKQRACV